MLRAAAIVSLACALAASAGCARKLAPTGGPRDVLPPSLVATDPDSGAVGVPRDAVIRLLFSETMDRHSVGQNVVLGPGVRSVTTKWANGKTLEIRPDAPLDSARTYVLLVPPGAMDVRANALQRAFVVQFTTAAVFPPGSIEGRVEGQGVTADGVYVWAYRDDLGRKPDSTAFDMDAFAQARGGGRFALVGLNVPGTYRLYTFVDRNRNRSFEPGVDLLGGSDSLVVLTADAPTASGVRAIATDPEALARVEGAVIDSLAPGTGALRIEARGVPVTPGVAADRVPVVTLDVTQGQFLGNLRGGRWRLVAYRDVDDDRTRSADEPSSDPVEVDVVPGGQAARMTLTLRPPAGGSP